MENKVILNNAQNLKFFNYWDKNTPCLNIFKYWKIIDCSILILNLNILGILKIEEIFEKFTEYPSDPV